MVEIPVRSPSPQPSPRPRLLPLPSPRLSAHPPPGSFRGARCEAVVCSPALRVRKPVWEWRGTMLDWERKRDLGSRALERGVTRGRLPPACTPQIRQPHLSKLSSVAPGQYGGQRKGLVFSDATISPGCTGMGLCTPGQAPPPNQRPSHPPLPPPYLNHSLALIRVAVFALWVLLPPPSVCQSFQ